MPENKGIFGAISCKSFISFGSGCSLAVPQPLGMIFHSAENVLLSKSITRNNNRLKLLNRKFYLCATGYSLSFLFFQQLFHLPSLMLMFSMSAHCNRPIMASSKETTTKILFSISMQVLHCPSVLKRLEELWC